MTMPLMVPLEHHKKVRQAYAEATRRILDRDTKIEWLEGRIRVLERYYKKWEDLSAMFEELKQLVAKL